MTAPTTESWQVDGLAGLTALTPTDLPSFEILYLDSLAARLLGSGGLEPPFTVEHGAEVVAFLLQAAINAPAYVPEQIPAPTGPMTLARQAVLAGAHDLASRGMPGLAQLVNRVITAAVGELERQSGSPEEQVRSLFRYGLLALASGPDNELAVAAAEGIEEVFSAWDDLIGAGFVPPWRSVAGASAG
jgi:hypothetical protein